MVCHLLLLLLTLPSLRLAPYTHKADVWSYGVTAWEVFSKAEIPYAHIPHNHSVINYIRNGQKEEDEGLRWTCVASRRTLETTGEMSTESVHDSRLVLVGDSR